MSVHTSNFIGNELLTFLPNSVCRSPTVEYTVTRKSVDQDPVLFQKGFDPRLSLYPTRSHLFWWNMERFRLLDNARHILIFLGNVHRTQKFFQAVVSGVRGQRWQTISGINGGGFHFGPGNQWRHRQTPGLGPLAVETRKSFKRWCPTYFTSGHVRLFSTKIRLCWKNTGKLHHFPARGGIARILLRHLLLFISVIEPRHKSFHSVPLFLGFRFGCLTERGEFVSGGVLPREEGAVGDGPAPGDGVPVRQSPPDGTGLPFLVLNKHDPLVFIPGEVSQSLPAQIVQRVLQLPLLHKVVRGEPRGSGSTDVVEIASVHPLLDLAGPLPPPDDGIVDPLPSPPLLFPPRGRGSVNSVLSHAACCHLRGGNCLS